MTNPAPRPALARVRDMHCAGPCAAVTPHLFRIDYLAGLASTGRGPRSWLCRDCGTAYAPHLIPRDALRHDADDPKETT
jgi:hypothetical protein